MSRRLHIHLPELHDAQRVIHESTARFRVACCGRRFGKTLLGSGEAIESGLRGGRAWWVAPTYKLGRPGWRGSSAIASQIPGARLNRTEHTVRLPGGGEVACRSADDPQSLRGDSLDLVVPDECRQMREVAWTEALRAALSDRRGRALFISTPAGHNWFWRLWMRGKDPEFPEWESFQFATSANPYIDPREIEQAHKSLPDRVFRQEFLAEFLAGEGQVFRDIYECATATEQERALPGHSYVIGVDWGRVNDFTVLAVIDEQLASLVALDRFTGIGYDLQVGRLLTMCERFTPRLVVPETNSMGGPLVERLATLGLPVRPFSTTNATKTAAVDALALAFETGSIRILADPVLLGELEAFEEHVTPMGLRKHSAPGGMHDDCVMALALAWSQTVRMATSDPGDVRAINALDSVDGLLTRAF